MSRTEDGTRGTLARRTVLTLAGGTALVVAGAGAASALGGVGATTASPGTAPGWPALAAGSSRLSTSVVEGTTVEATLRSGPVDTVLRHVVRRVHYELAPIDPGQLVSHVGSDRVTPETLAHPSGAAVTIRPGFHPAGQSGALTPVELATVRDILAECRGVVRWGGDDPVALEGQFRIDRRPGDRDLRALAAALGAGDGRLGRSAGSQPDVFSPGRRSAAKALAGRQRVGR